MLYLHYTLLFVALSQLSSVSLKIASCGHLHTFFSFCSLPTRDHFGCEHTGADCGQKVHSLTESSAHIHTLSLLVETNGCYCWVMWHYFYWTKLASISGAILPLSGKLAVVGADTLPAVSQASSWTESAAADQKVPSFAGFYCTKACAFVCVSFTLIVLSLEIALCVF